jgi:hypothetical protein
VFLSLVFFDTFLSLVLVHYAPATFLLLLIVKNTEMLASKKNAEQFFMPANKAEKKLQLYAVPKRWRSALLSPFSAFDQSLFFPTRCICRWW